MLVTSPLDIDTIEAAIEAIDGRHSHAHQKVGGERTGRESTNCSDNRTRFTPRLTSELHTANEVRTPAPHVAFKPRKPIESFKCGGPHGIGTCKEIKSPEEKKKFWDAYKASQAKKSETGSSSSVATPQQGSANRTDKQRSHGPQIIQQNSDSRKPPILRNHAKFCLSDDDKHYANSIWEQFQQR